MKDLCPWGSFPCQQSSKAEHGSGIPHSEQLNPVLDSNQIILSRFVWWVPRFPKTGQPLRGFLLPPGSAGGKGCQGRGQGKGEGGKGRTSGKPSQGCQGMFLDLPGCLFLSCCVVMAGEPFSDLFKGMQTGKHIFGQIEWIRCRVGMHLRAGALFSEALSSAAGPIVLSRSKSPIW